MDSRQGPFSCCGMQPRAAHLQLHAKPQVTADGHTLLARHGHCSRRQRSDGAEQAVRQQALRRSGAAASAAAATSLQAAASTLAARPQLSHCPWALPGALQARKKPVDHLWPSHCTRKSARGGMGAGIGTMQAAAGTLQETSGSQGPSRRGAHRHSRPGRPAPPAASSAAITDPVRHPDASGAAAGQRGGQLGEGLAARRLAKRLSLPRSV